MTAVIDPTRTVAGLIDENRTEATAPGVRSFVRRLVAAALRDERERLILWIPVIVAVGVGIYFALRAEPPLWTGPLATGVFGSGALLAVAFVQRGRAALVLTIVALTLASIGFTVAQVRTALVATPVLGARIGPVTVTGTAIATEVFDKGGRITLDQPDVEGLEPAQTPRRIRIRLRGDQPTIVPGDRVRARAMLIPVPPPSRPGAFDFQRQAFFEGIGATGFALGAVAIDERTAGAVSTSLGMQIARLRRVIAERISATVGGNAGAVIAALIVGDRGRISQPAITAIRNAGLAHLLAISGLHIGLVAGSVFLALRLLASLSPEIALRWPVKKLAAVAAMVTAGVYMQLAGASIPTQRAFLMIAVVFTAVILDRRGISLRLVAFAALIILLFRPEALLGASFQLSFAAVIALVAVYETPAATRLVIHGEGRSALAVFRYPAGIAATTIIATLATAPLAAYHFNQVAWYGIVANVIGVPLTALWIMPWAVLSLLLMPLNLEVLGLTPMAWGVRGLIAIAEGVSDWPGAVSGVPAIPRVALLVWVAGGLWLALWRSGWRWLGMLGFAVAAVIAVNADGPDVLVDADGRLLAVSLPDERLALSSKTPRFTAATWLRAAGQEEPGPQWPKLGASADGALSCDPSGCLYRRHGIVVAFVRTTEAVDDDCRAADVVISTVPIRSPCPAPGPVIDRFDLRRDGAHAVWLNNGTIKVLSVRGARGQRPWTPELKRRRPT
jgi:competence protein ComEC